MIAFVDLPENFESGESETTKRYLWIIQIHLSI